MKFWSKDKDNNEIINITVYLSFIYSIVIIALSNSKFLSFLGYDDNMSYTIASMFNYLTGPGRFDDFFNPIAYSQKDLGQMSSFTLSPLAIYFAKACSISPVASLFLFIGISLLIWFYCIRKILPKYLIVPLLFSYPILFSISRGNYEITISGLIFLAIIFLYFTNLKNKYTFALIMITLGASLKPTCILFYFLIPINEMLKKWYIFVVFGVLNLMIIYALYPSLTMYYQSMQFTLMAYYNDYIIGGGGSMFNNSLWGLVKIFYLYFGGYKNQFELVQNLNLWYGFYKYINLLSIALLVLLVINSKNILNKIGLVTIATILLNGISADYKVIYMLIYVCLLINYLKTSEKVDNKIFFIIIASILVIIPKHFLFIREFKIFGDSFTIQSIINPILLISILILIITSMLFYKSNISQNQLVKKL